MTQTNLVKRQESLADAQTKAVGTLEAEAEITKRSVIEKEMELATEPRFSSLRVSEYEAKGAIDRSNESALISTQNYFDNKTKLAEAKTTLLNAYATHIISKNKSTHEQKLEKDKMTHEERLEELARTHEQALKEKDREHETNEQIKLEQARVEMSLEYGIQNDQAYERFKQEQTTEFTPQIKASWGNEETEFSEDGEVEIETEIDEAKIEERKNLDEE